MLAPGEDQNKVVPVQYYYSQSSFISSYLNDSIFGLMMQCMILLQSLKTAIKTIFFLLYKITKKWGFVLFFIPWILADTKAQCKKAPLIS